MNLKKAIRKAFGQEAIKTTKGVLKNKRGSYIVEAALTLPVLILCLCALVLIIRIIATCETVTFFTAEEMQGIDLGAYKITNSVSLCKDIEERAKEEGLSNFKVTSFKYLYNQGHMTDLIALEAFAEFHVINAIGIDAETVFEERLLTRGFTGTVQSGEALEESEFQKAGVSRQVIVFPKYGTKYHRQSCRYVKQHKGEELCRLTMEQEDASRKGYTPCKVCGGAANV